MQNKPEKLIQGYQQFKRNHSEHEISKMQSLALEGQQPEHMVVSCCDSRVDPSTIFQTQPGELFITRNVANIVPPYEADNKHHGTSAALEYGVCYLKVKHLVVMGHSFCGGIQARLNQESLHQNDFLSSWVSIINVENKDLDQSDTAKQGLIQSHQNCLTFPWIKSRVENNQLAIHLWFFDIETISIEAFNFQKNIFLPLCAN